MIAGVERARTGNERDAKERQEVHAKDAKMGTLRVLRVGVTVGQVRDTTTSTTMRVWSLPVS